MDSSNPRSNSSKPGWRDIPDLFQNNSVIHFQMKMLNKQTNSASIGMCVFHLHQPLRELCSVHSATKHSTAKLKLLFSLKEPPYWTAGGEATPILIAEIGLAIQLCPPNPASDGPFSRSVSEADT